MLHGYIIFANSGIPLNHYFSMAEFSDDYIALIASGLTGLKQFFLQAMHTSVDKVIAGNYKIVLASAESITVAVLADVDDMMAERFARKFAGRISHEVKKSKPNLSSVSSVTMALNKVFLDMQNELKRLIANSRGLQYLAK